MSLSFLNKIFVDNAKVDPQRNDENSWRGTWAHSNCLLDKVWRLPYGALVEEFVQKQNEEIIIKQLLIENPACGQGSYILQAVQSICWEYTSTVIHPSLICGEMVFWKAATSSTTWCVHWFRAAEPWQRLWQYTCSYIFVMENELLRYAIESMLEEFELPYLWVLWFLGMHWSTAQTASSPSVWRPNDRNYYQLIPVYHNQHVSAIVVLPGAMFGTWC